MDDYRRLIERWTAERSYDRLDRLIRSGLVDQPWSIEVPISRNSAYRGPLIFDLLLLEERSPQLDSLCDFLLLAAISDASVNTLLSKNRSTLLMWLVEYSDTDTEFDRLDRFITRFRPDVNLKSRRQTAVSVALRTESYSDRTLLRLLDESVDLNQTVERKTTYLQIAAETGRISAFETLIRRGG